MTRSAGHANARDSLVSASGDVDCYVGIRYDEDVVGDDGGALGSCGSVQHVRTASRAIDAGQ